MTIQDSAKKIAAITKLGVPVLAWGRTRGLVLGYEEESDNGSFRVSLSDSGVNWVDIIHHNNIQVDDGVYRESDTKNEYVEQEEEGCEGGACKI